jgi:ABC-type Fe3+/spermidine/putrescine transport system ATPase subunit
VEEREGSRVVVRLDGGLRVHAEAPAGSDPGTKVDVAVRPEKIQMSLDKPGSASVCLEGTVAGVVYQGAVTEYQVEPPAGAPVRVVVQNTREAWEAERVPVGRRVYLSWPEAASLVLSVRPADEVATGDDEASGRGGA